MKNYTFGLLFILFGFSAFAQGITPTEGYYRTVNNYKQENIDFAGELVSATATDLVFKYLYNKLYYNSRNVWGYRDKDGNDYRSIDGKFYQIINGKKIFVFELKENDETIHKIKAKVIAGAANNQLANEQIHGQILKERGITYAPDFLINAGGIINVYGEIVGYDKAEALRRTENIYNTTLEIFSFSELQNITTHQAALSIAEKRIAERKKENTNRV